tara:strand:+ start:52 stop:249 length:198 start_codon:yes stop_codon:yes gene_type:complete
MLTKKEIKEKIKHTKEIERMLLMMLTDRTLTDDHAHLLVGELLTAAEFVVRFKNVLKEMKGRESE